MKEQNIRPGDANLITRKYMDSILIEQRLIDSCVPSLEMELFGERFATPIMMPAFSHLKAFGDGRESGMVEYAIAAKNLNSVNFVGMCENEEFAEIMKAGAKTVRIIKPYADKDKIFQQIAFAQEQGAFAVGMDIDHIFGTDGKLDVVVGELMAPQSLSDIRNYVEATKLPFIVKGVLSVQDAVKCAECGVQGILVSHHSGRLPYAIPPLMILPEIVQAVGGKKGVKVFVDCGMNSGVDAYKALALGADAVAVGRALMPSLMKEGCAGVESFVQKMNQELAFIMGFTGCASLKEMDPGVLRLPKECSWI